MSYFEDASVVFIPSAVKDGKTYSIKPTDGSGDLTFSRGSDIEATRVASNGYIEKAKVNLLLQSNSFSDASWSKIRSSVTSGQTGYDGSSNAWKLESTDAADSYVARGLTQGGIQTFSVYAKAGNVNYIYFRIAGTTSQGAYIDLSDGSVSSYFNEANIIGGAVVNNIGSGWYRISIAVNTTSSEVRFFVSDSGAVTSAIGSFIYLQDAQLNYGLVAQEYQETTTTSVVSGITNDLPRLDYSGGASCPSLLLEPSRQNLVQQSEYIDTYWNPFGNISITHNSLTSPEGVQNAAEISAAATTTAGIGIQRGVSVTANNDYTISFFAKKGDFRYVQIFHGGGQVSTNPRTNFDLQEGVVAYEETGVVTAKVEDYGNGWYRCSATMEALLTTLQAYIVVAPTANAARSPSVSATAGENYYIYGIQIEAGSYPTSYIPCYGTSNSRNSESCSKTGISSLIGQTEGTVFLEITTTNDITTVTPIGISDGTASNRVLLYVGSGILNALVTVSGVAQATISSSAISANTRYKMAIAYKANDFAFYVNGALVGIDTNGTVPACSKFNYDNGSGSAPFYGLSNQALLFKTRLSNADLATLTTL